MWAKTLTIQERSAGSPRVIHPLRADRNFTFNLVLVEVSLDQRRTFWHCLFRGKKKKIHNVNKRNLNLLLPAVFALVTAELVFHV